MSQKKNEGILFPTEIRVVGSYTDRLLSSVAMLQYFNVEKVLRILCFEKWSLPRVFFFFLNLWLGPATRKSFNTAKKNALKFVKMARLSVFC